MLELRALAPRFTLVAAAIGCLVVLSPRRADAHFNLVMPPPADSATDGGKGAPPCGPTTASNVVTSVQGGHAITLAVDETVLHPGWYRVALSINSRSELPADPMVTVSGGNSTNAAYMTTPVFPVLADHLFNHTSGTTPIHYTMSLTLPNVTCTKCTLQVIEFMNMHGSNPGGGYFYHHCADLKITADPALPPFELPDGGVPDASGAGGSAAGGRGGQGGQGRGGQGGSTATGTAGRGGTSGGAGDAGTTGAAGTTGSAGNAGTTGAAGTTGSAGNVGTTGASGSVGTTGASGSVGTTGSAGNVGTTGASGTNGGAGTTGASGSNGTTGASGTNGATDSGGGCSLSTNGARGAGLTLLALVFVALGGLRRRRRR